MTHSAAGGLSTVIEFAASDEPKKNAFQLCRTGLRGRRVEGVGPARSATGPRGRGRRWRRAARSARRGASGRCRSSGVGRAASGRAGSVGTVVVTMADAPAGVCRRVGRCASAVSAPGARPTERTRVWRVRLAPTPSPARRASPAALAAVAPRRRQPHRELRAPGPARAPSTVPPCAATTASTIARPSPVLPVSRDRDAIPRANRSNTCGSRSGGMPGRCRDGQLDAAVRRGRGRRSPSCPPACGVRALASRLASTWVSRGRVAGHDDRLVGQVELPAVVRARRHGRR